jgi:hypothetical protein
MTTCFGRSEKRSLRWQILKVKRPTKTTTPQAWITSLLPDIKKREKRTKNKDQQSKIRKYLDYLHDAEPVVRKGKETMKTNDFTQIIKSYLAEIESSQTDNPHQL